METPAQARRIAIAIAIALPCAILALASVDVATASADDRPSPIIIRSKDPAADKRSVALQKAMRTAASASSTARKKLGVTHELVGELDRRDTRYTLTLSLRDTATQKRVRSLRDTTTEKSDVRRWARTLLIKILDEGTGELVLVANARRGRVLVDGVPVTELYEGRATISGIALGTHEVEIRAVGYRPFSIDVDVDGRTEQTVLLDPISQ